MPGDEPAFDVLAEIAQVSRRTMWSRVLEFQHERTMLLWDEDQTRVNLAATTLRLLHAAKFPSTHGLETYVIRGDATLFALEEPGTRLAYALGGNTVATVIEVERAVRREALQGQANLL